MNGPAHARRFPSSLWLLLLALCCAACDESGPRVFTAKAYDPDAKCLALDAPVALVEADELGATCDPACLELGGVLYVSSVCPPYPMDSVLLTTDDSEVCASALMAFADDVQCEE
jgi:hypothetical protein